MATPDSSASGAGSAREEAERLVAAVLARASDGASQAAWMAHGAKFAARASGHQTTSTGLGMLGDALRGVAKTASGFSEDLQKSSEGTKEGRAAGAEPDPRPSGRATPMPGGPPAGTAPSPSAPGPPRSDAAFDEPAGLKDESAGSTDESRQHGEPGPVAGWATGSAECCVCPVCRGITLMRNPSPEFAEQLATSAGDLAAGVAGLLRAFSTAAADTSARPAAPKPAARPSTAPKPDAPEPAPADLGKTAAQGRHEDSGTGWPAADPWSAATRAAASEPPAGDPWAAATRDTHAGHPADIDAPGTGDHEREFREAG